MAKPSPITGLMVDEYLGLRGDDLVAKLVPALNEHLVASADGFSNGLTLRENVAASVLTKTLPAVPNTSYTAVAASGQPDPSFKNSWVNFDTATWFAAGFIVDPDGWVKLRGLVKSGTPSSTSVIFTLPAGYRPSLNAGFACDSNNAHGRCTVKSTGDVVAEAGSGVHFFLDSVCFQAEGSVAAPPAFVGTGWPYVFAHGLQIDPLWLEVARVVDVTTSASASILPSENTSIGGVKADWEPVGGGQVRIKRLSGLAPGRTYRVTFIVFGG